MPRRLTVLALVLALSTVAATAEAALYRDTKGLGGGGRGIELKIRNGKLKRIRGALPAHCERQQGDFNTTLKTFLTGTVKLGGGRFHVHVDDPNTNVEVNIRGRLRNGVVRGRVRMTYLELHVGSPANDTLCDSGVRFYKAMKV